MPSHVENPIVDIETLAKHIGRALRREVDKRGLLMWDVQKKTSFSRSTFSQYLWARPSKNEDVYREIAKAIGLSDSQFDTIKAEVIQEHFGVAAADRGADMRYALSSKLWDNPEAIKEVEGFMQFVKQKYGIK